MTVEIADTRGPGGAASRWGRVLAVVSIAGTILAVMSVFVLTLGAAMLVSGFDGSDDPTWWFWLIASGFATVGLAGLLLTSRLPTVAYILRLVAVLPLLALGFVTPWLMLPVILVGGADLSLMVSHRSWGHQPLFRVLAGVVTTVVLIIVIVPLSEVRSCENPGHRAACEVRYGSVLGYTAYAPEEQNLIGWGLLAVLGGLLVALPVTRDTGDYLV